MRGKFYGILSAVKEDRGRLFLWVPVLIACGVSLYFSLSVEPSLWLTVGITALLGLFLFLPISRRSEVFRIILLIFFWVSIGFTAGKVREVSVAQPILQQKTGAIVTGEIVQIDASDKKRRIVIRIMGAEPADLKLPDQVRVSDRFGKVMATPGDIIKADLFLLPLPSPTHPEAFDFQRQLYFKGIGAVGYIRDVISVSEGRRGFSIQKMAEDIRYQLGQEVLKQASNETAGFLLAIMTGERKALSKEVQENMRKSGLAHLLAISGLHMGMLGGIIFFMVRLMGAMVPRIALTFPLKKGAAVTALAGMAGYLLISGMSVSAIRAFFMISLVFVAILFDRRAISFRNLAIAAIFILLFWPESLLGASFHMSFAAVFCLIAAYERYGDAFWVKSAEKALPVRSLQYLGGVLLTSVIASLATAPFSAFHFGQVALAGNIANLVAVPVMGLLVMPLVLVCFLLYPLGFMSWGLELASIGVQIILKVADMVADLRYAAISIPSFSPWALYAAVLGILWFIIWRSKIRYIAVLLIVFSIGATFTYHRPDILISESGRLVLIRNEGMSYVTSRRVDRFERTRWQQVFGEADTYLLTEEAAQAAGIHCDDLGCIARMRGMTVAISKTVYSHSLDCRKSDILIAADPVQIPCDGPDIIIDRFDVWRQGGHSLWLNGKESHLMTVNGVRGDRPWVPSKAREHPN